MIKRIISYLKRNREYKLALDFERSKLRGKSMLFHNNVGIILTKDANNKFDCISEAITNTDHCIECLPKDAKIKFSGMRFMVETDNELSNDEIEALENMGFQYLGAVVPTDQGHKWQTELFCQDPDYWSKDFEEFLLTFHDFCQKKYEERLKN